MARSHLTLAALATSAVDGLDAVRARGHSYGQSGDFDAAVVSRQTGADVLVRVPTHQAAESEQSADMVALAALTSGVRSLLPFRVPKVVGQAPVDGTRAVVYEYIPGDAIAAATINETLAAQLAQAVAAIHELPTGFVEEAGLTTLSPAGIRAEAEALVDRADATHQVPAALLERWRTALADDDLWQVYPTVTNGSLTTDSFVIDTGDVAAVIGWSQLAVDDPARDLVWLRSLDDASATAAYLAYRQARGITDSASLAMRAALYAELDVAKWLLHGQSLHDSGIISDAVSMMDNLVENVHNDAAEPLAADEAPALAVSEVRDLLGRTPGASTPAPDGLEPIVDDDAESESTDEDWRSH